MIFFDVWAADTTNYNTASEVKTTHIIPASAISNKTGRFDIQWADGIPDVVSLQRNGSGAISMESDYVKILNGRIRGARYQRHSNATPAKFLSVTQATDGTITIKVNGAQVALAYIDGNFIN